MCLLARISPVCLLVLALASGCGDDGGSVPISIDAQPPDAAPRETIMEDMLLAPGEITEGIMTGGAGDLAEIHLTAPMAELDWNIHGHAGGGTQVIHEEYDQMKMDYIFAPTAHADWYLLFRNSGPTDMTVKLKVDLHGGMQWRWQ
jgi:hypothetical protein